MAVILAWQLGCAGGHAEQGPNLGEHLTIQDGEPAVIMDSQDVTQTVSNTVFDPNKRVIAFDFDFKSKNSAEHYTGKIFNLRRDVAGRVTSFEAIINGQHGTVVSQAEPSLLPNPRADREAAKAAENARLEAKAKETAKRAAMRNTTNQTLEPLKFLPGANAAGTAQGSSEWADASKFAVKQAGLLVSVDDLQFQANRLRVRLKVQNRGDQAIDFRGWSAASAEDQPRLRDQTNAFLKRVPTATPARRLLRTNETITESLEFEAAPSRIEYLRLELPADVFEGYGLLRFHLPRTFLLAH
ncbi:MAG: hypothetical protein FJ271_07790 [Planctomycetes bacterium]|nr:hypothetical protein [Planctomycetota bacterium]